VGDQPQCFLLIEDRWTARGCLAAQNADGVLQDLDNVIAGRTCRSGPVLGLLDRDIGVVKGSVAWVALGERFLFRGWIALAVNKALGAVCPDGSLGEARSAQDGPHFVVCRWVLLKEQVGHGADDMMTVVAPRPSGVRSAQQRNQR
jgi:hypothetical protein